MKKLAYLIIAFFMTLTAFAQPSFQKIYYSSAMGEFVTHSMIQTSDGGYALTGTTEDFGAQMRDVFLLKLNSVGDTMWMNIFGSDASGDDVGLSLVQTMDGGYVIGGKTDSAGNEDMLIIRTNNLGTYNWSRRFGGVNTEQASSITQLANGSIVIAGFTSSYGAGASDGYVVAIDTSANFLWEKSFGGVNEDEFLSVSSCVNGGFILSGYSDSWSSPAAYLVRADNNGDTLWTKLLGGGNDRAQSVQQIPSDSGYIVGGDTYIYGTGGQDAFLARLDQDGAITWFNTYGTSDDDGGYAVTATSDSGFFLGGESWGTADHTSFLVKTNGSGDTTWTKFMGYNSSETSAIAVVESSDSGLVWAGSGSYDLTGNIGSYISKYSKTGLMVGCNELWIQPYVLNHSVAINHTTPTLISNTSSYAAVTILQNQGLMPSSTSFGLQLQLDSTATSCIGSSDGSASVIITCGIPPYSYLWSNSDTNDTISGLMAGYYYVTVTDANGNMAIDTVNVPDPPVLTAMPSFTNFTYCDSACTGMAESMTSGGTAPYTYAWSNGETTYDADSLCLGMAYLTLTDANGCSVTDSIDIMADPAGNFQPQIWATTQPACSTACNAELWVDGQGLAPYTFLWDDPAAQTTDTVTGLCVGTTVVKVWDAMGCIAFDTISLTPVGDTMGLAMVGYDRTCNVWCNGGASAGISGNIPGPFVYSWNDPLSQTTQDADSLCAGTYTLVFSDTNGCFSLTDSITINNVFQSLSLTFSQQNASCAGVCDAQAQVIDAGGFPANQWLWDDPATQTTATATGLCSGTHTVIVTDDQGCTSDTASVVISDIVPTITLIMDSVNVICNGICDGVGFVTANATYPPVSYLWSDPGAQTTDTASGLCPGTYTVSVTDTLGCMTVTDSITVGTDPFTPEPICVISVDSTSTKNVIVWEKPATAGIDSIRVYRDIVGTYTHVGSVPYNAISYYEDTTSGINPTITSYRYKISTIDTCGAESALSGFHKTIHLQVVPGIPPAMQLSWDDYEGFGFTFYRILRDTTGLGLWEKIDSTSFGINSLTDPNPPQTGNLRYIVEVVAPATCVATKQKNFNSSKSNTAFTASGPALDLTASTTSATSGNCDGSATALPTGGATPYTYSWNTSPVQTSATATGLCGNTDYTVMVTDAFGDTMSTSVFISELASTLGVTASATDASFGICDASAVATPTGGTSPYTYSWNTSPVQTNATAFGLCGNTSYSVLITDAAGDTISTTVLVPELTSIDDQLLNELFDLYPNPNTGSFTVDLDVRGSDKWSLRVFNILGSELQSENLGVINGNVKKAIELSKTGTGIYYVQLSNGKVSMRKKVVIY